MDENVEHMVLVKVWQPWLNALLMLMLHSEIIAWRLTQESMVTQGCLAVYLTAIRIKFQIVVEACFGLHQCMNERGRD